MQEVKKTIQVTWKEKVVCDRGRVGARYCFKNCQKNQN